MDAKKDLPADLARETDALRRIARGLLFEPALAEDAVQDAWLAALRSRKRDTQGGWLVEAVRRIALGIRRREARCFDRERVAARREATPSAAETAERIELLRKLIGALDALEEPYRTAVRLRLIDDLPPRAIAERLQLPVETVRTQVRRGIERMRATLDGEHRGRRESFLGVLAPLIGTEALRAGLAAHAGFGTLGGVLVGAKVKWIAALVAMAIVAAGWRWHSTASSTRETHHFAPADSVRPPSSLASIPDGDRQSDELAAPLGPGSGARAVVASPTRSSGWRICGRTQIGRSEPLAGAMLNLTVRRGYDGLGEVLVVRELVSDQHGVFETEFEWPTTGVLVMLRGTMDDYWTSPSWRIVPPGCSPPGDLEVQFFPLDIEVHGRVLDGDGEPIVGARVDGLGEVAAANAAGEFVVRASTHLTPRKFTAWADGYAEKIAAVALRRPGVLSDVVFQLDRATRMGGGVVDDAGRPMAGARIEASFAQHTDVASDAEGRFELKNVPPHPGWFWVSATVEGRPPAVHRHDNQDPPEDDIVLILEPGFDVVGRVLDDHGAPVAGAAIGLGEWDPQSTRAMADDDGRFVVRAVAKRETMVSAAHDGFAPYLRTIEYGPDGGCAPLTIVLERGFEIRGHVHDVEGRAIAGVSVAVRVDGDYPNIDRATSASDGSFVLERVPHGGLVLLECFSAGWVREEQPLIGDPLSVEVTLSRAAGLAGRVIDAATGKPVRRFRVRFMDPQLRPEELRLAGYRSAWSESGLEFDDPNGEWNTAREQLQADRVIGVEVRAAGFGTAILPRVVTKVGPDPAELVIRLGPELVVTGRVIAHDDGRALCGARLRTFSAREPLHFYEPARLPEAVTDATGEFRLEQMPNEPVSLYVEAEGFAPRVDGPFEPMGSETRRLVELTSGAKIRGRVVHVGGHAVAGARVHLGSAFSSDRPYRFWERDADADGRFEFENVPIGEFYVTRAVPNGRGGSLFEFTQQVKVTEGGEHFVELRPPGTLVLRGELRAAVALPGDLAVRAMRSSDQASVVGIAHGATFELTGLAAGRWMVSAEWYEGQGERDLTGTTQIDLVDGPDAHIVIDLAPPRR